MSTIYILILAILEAYFRQAKIKRVNKQKNICIEKDSNDEHNNLCPVS